MEVSAKCFNDCVTEIALSSQEKSCRVSGILTFDGILQYFLLRSLSTTIKFLPLPPIILSSLSRDVEGAYEEELRQRREISEKAGLADRRANALQAEMEEARSLLESADRSRKQAELELADTRAAVNEMTTINSRANSDKRRAEAAIHTLHAEIDDMVHQVWTCNTLCSLCAPLPVTSCSSFIVTW